MGLSREQIVDLLYYLGASKVVNKETKKDIMFTCTVHGENNPSAGYDVEKEVFHCFSCHESGGVEWWAMKSLPDTFKSIYEVDKFIQERYGVDLKRSALSSSIVLPRYSEIKNKEEKSSVNDLPKKFLAPYRCGKETYKYFFDRGFTKETMRNFQIGRDLENETVVVPIYYEDKLQGMIGRYIDPNRRSNERYKIYEVPTGMVLYPMHKTKALNDTIILVEGLLDALYMHQLGFTNTVAILTNFLSHNQALWVRRNSSKVIDLTDNDEMGVIATQSICKKLKRYCTVIDGKQFYPQGKKDPQECSEKELKELIKKCLSSNKVKLKRL